MNILLLGGSGFIGGRVAALLRKHGHNVTTAHHHELNLLNLAENQAKVFLNQKDDLEHAYNKLNIVKGKPSFEELYSYLLLFLEPFYKENTKSNSVWDNDKKEWSDDK